MVSKKEGSHRNENTFQVLSRDAFDFSVRCEKSLRILLAELVCLDCSSFYWFYLNARQPKSPVCHVVANLVSLNAHSNGYRSLLYD